MKYTIKAHPTWYAGVLFRSRLEARWAAFFDLAEWRWEYEPLDLPGWSPDFLVEFRCGHSECGPTHTLLVEIKPYLSLREFDGHPSMEFLNGVKWVETSPGVYDHQYIPADSSACFGNNPDVTYWQMGHGSGGGEYSLDSWCSYGTDLWSMWKESGRLTQFKHQENNRQQRGTR
jgi:hypothetical protein